MIVHPGPAHDGPPSAAAKAAVERFNDAKKLFSTLDLSPVRGATEADRDAVEQLARLMHAEVGLSTIADDKLRATIDLGIRRPRRRERAGQRHVPRHHSKFIAGRGDRSAL